MNQTNAARCPLCGAHNGCHMAIGRNPKICWCHQTVVPKALLNTIPEHQRGQSCVCQRCIATYHEQDSST